MEKKYIMAMDQGTTSCRAILFDKNGRICSMAQKEFPQYYPRPGWVEHDPMEIWSSQLSVSTEAMSRIRASAEEIAAIGITNQRETTIVWDKYTGNPVYPAIVWQCRRTAGMVEELCEKGFDGVLRERTGLVPDAYFSATKVKWILDHVKGAKSRAQKGELLFGTVDTWLIWNLTKGKVHVTDYTNASRTMLYDIHKLQWDEEILDMLEIPRQMLPQVEPSSRIYGYTDILGSSIPIGGAAGDQQAALFGQCCVKPGDVKNTYGTGCFLLMYTGGKPIVSQHGLLTTIAVDEKGKPAYALEGSVFVAGAAIQWLRDELGIIGKASDSERCCQAVEDTNGAYLVPAFTGMGAPYWKQDARGVMVGLTRGVSKNHMVRAAVESLAYQVYDLIGAMERESRIQLRELKVDGGASANDFLMQFQADILNACVVRPSCIETTALGAAYLAGLAAGYWDSMEEIRKNWSIQAQFKPDMDEETRQRRLGGWRRAVKTALSWEAEDTL
ncbi:MAG: glycerol kinase GlpK [Lachnospiraceae bacterium]|nr:glycerol kinase GlpK [Lachnospiraceae bacterium]